MSKAALMQRRRWYVLPLVVAVLLLAAGVAVASSLSHAGGGRTSGVEVRSGLSDYSWPELSRIADEIAACKDERAAYAVAARYGLCAEGGSLDALATKEVALTDGTLAHVTVAGIWHDERSDGGKAGLSFVFADAMAQRAINHAFEDAEGDSADSRGGWAACDLRTWLDSDGMVLLPPELRTRVVRVQKHTASAVDTLDEAAEPGSLAGAAADWVGETSDRLWLLSAAELCGDVPEMEDLGVETTMAKVYGSEGSQYRLFADAGVRAFATNEALVRTLAGDATDAACTWWLRTKTLEFDDGFWLVGTDGTPLNGYGEDVRVVEDPEYAPDELWGPDHARGVVVGFCL